MNARAERKIRAADRAADALTELGHHQDANAIRELIRAHRSSVILNSQLHADNMKLRNEAQNG